MNMICLFQDEFTTTLLQLIENSILNIDNKLYSFDQKQAWLSGINGKTLIQWQQYLTRQTTWVYCLESEPVALLSAKDDYLDLLYVAPAQQGLGYGKILLQHFLNHCNNQTVWAKASLAALPFFLSQGFKSQELSFAHRENITLPFHQVVFTRSLN